MAQEGTGKDVFPPEAGREERRDPAYADSLARFAGGIAHDFNNLLTVVNGYCELILAGEGDPLAYEDYVREILLAGKKAAELVRLILIYSEHAPQGVEVFDLHEMLEGFRDPLGLGMADGVRIRFDLCAGPIRLHAERNRIRWALGQMAKNAGESMPDGGLLEIATRCMPDGEAGCCRLDAKRPRCEIHIRDSGRGMSREELEHAFQPYFSTKKDFRGPGLGLGLACAQGIMHQAGGCIRAESAPGSGSLFRICLPLAPAPG